MPETVGDNSELGMKLSKHNFRGHRRLEDVMIFIPEEGWTGR